VREGEREVNRRVRRYRTDTVRLRGLGVGRFSVVDWRLSSGGPGGAEVLGVHEKKIVEYDDTGPTRSGSVGLEVRRFSLVDWRFLSGGPGGAEEVRGVRE